MQPLPPPPEAQSAAAGSSKTAAHDQRKSSFAARPQPSNTANTQNSAGEPLQNQSSTSQPPKKRKHRGGKKRRNRRQSFAVPPSETSAAASNMDALIGEEDEQTIARSPVRPGESFYKRRQNRSNESLDSDALLDHRHQTPMRPRRESRLNVLAAQKASLNATLGRQRSSDDRQHRRRRTGERSKQASEDGSEHEDINDRTPLMATALQHRSPKQQAGYGLFRSNTRGSSRSSVVRKRTKSNNVPGQSFPRYSDSPGYDVNNPPSVPGSPHLQASIEDPMMPGDNFLPRSPDSSRNLRSKTNGDVLVDIDRQEGLNGDPHSAPPSPRLNPEGINRHKRAMTFGADVDVCFPEDAMSELAEEDFDREDSRDEVMYSQRRRRRREWPQLWALDEWSREEKELRAADDRRAQRIQEPVMIEGRLRAPRFSAWHAEEAPNRFTYFNVEYESTIHAPTISELVPSDGSFRELFIPEPPLLEDSSSSESEDEKAPSAPAAKDGSKLSGMVSPKEQQGDNGASLSRLSTALGSEPRSRSQDPSRLSSGLTEQIKSKSRDPSRARSINHAEEQMTQQAKINKKEKPKHYGDRPQFWLDVLCPTAQEMQVLKAAFGIHPLTAEDIMQQEAREKVELFKNYYFINYRTFEQDQGSEDYLEPVNVYILVFQHGIITFHFSQIPHPANVRRRIRQLQDYLELTADWISYAIIDDITDVFGPMIQNIEHEVDEIDDAILQSTPGAFSINEKATGDQEVKKEQDKDKDGDDKSSLFSLPNFLKDNEKKKDTSGYDMLRRVGETRKKVMSLYRLLGTKAEVIKGFAKRCNEQWHVTPKNEIGLYLGDIQDHILTMTSNLSHYETLLSRAHSNYLAQVSIRMNERSEQTGDVLNKLTVFGTIVLPMNIICGMWGMNVKVPGQDIDNLWWFWGITAGLLAFAVGCYLLCKKLYGIV